MKEMQIKEEWDLGQMYKGPNDSNIEKDIKAVERKVSSFRKKYYKRTTSFKNPKFLKKVLEDYVKIIFHHGVIKPTYFLSLKRSLNSSDQVVEQKLFSYDERLTKLSNELNFLEISLSKLSKKDQKNTLKSSELLFYRYFLEKIFARGRHTLSEQEEKILNLDRQTGYTLWVQGLKKFMSKQTVLYKGKELPLEEALSLANKLPTKERRSFFEKTYEVLEKGIDFAESELNAVVIRKKIVDELCGYEKPYSGTALSFENTEKEIEAVVSAVSGDFKTSAKFFALKKKVLKLKDLEYADRNVSVGKINKKFTFKESVKILRKAFGNLDPRLVEILDRMLANGQVSVYPKRGKSGGAFCMSDSKVPTYVLLNHTNDFESLRTFAHEMGHALHSELSKKQDLLYQNYPISTAEVASTFFEKVLIDEVEKHLSKKEKVVLLSDQINGQINTVHRQIAAFNFELDLHHNVRREGFQSKEKIKELMCSHLKKYLGRDVKVPEYVGNLFVIWGHFRRYFYVYTYAYGNLISNALYAIYKNNPDDKDKVMEFLSAGGSVPPRKLFAKLGIDTEKEETYKLGLSVIKKEVEKLDKLLR